MMTEPNFSGPERYIMECLGAVDMAAEKLRLAIIKDSLTPENIRYYLEHAIECLKAWEGKDGR